MNSFTRHESIWFTSALEREIAKSPLQIDTIQKKNNYVREWNNARLEMLNEQLGKYLRWEGRLQVK